MSAKAAAEEAEMARCKAAIVQMLETNNRPFNGNNLVDDLAAQFKKSLTMKALAALTEEKTITVKLFGKVKIYLADQAKFKIPDEASLVALDNECHALENKLKTVLAENNELIDQRARIEATPTNKKLLQELERLKNLTASQQVQLRECQKSESDGSNFSNGGPDDHARNLDKTTLDRALAAVSKAAQKRKRACREVVSDLAVENNAVTEDLIDMIGIDEDGYYDQLFFDD